MSERCTKRPRSTLLARSWWLRNWKYYRGGIAKARGADTDEDGAQHLESEGYKISKCLRQINDGILGSTKENLDPSGTHHASAHTSRAEDEEASSASFVNDEPWDDTAQEVVHLESSGDQERIVSAHPNRIFEDVRSQAGHYVYLTVHQYLRTGDSGTHTPESCWKAFAENPIATRVKPENPPSLKQSDHEPAS